MATRSIHQATGVEVNAVLRNTYMLLSMTLLFSALMSGIAMMIGAQPVNIILLLAGYLILPMLITKNRNSSAGLAFTFLYTGFVGWTIGPILNLYIATFSNGGELIMMALGGTGLIFLGLSAFAMNPNRDMSNWGSFLAIGALVAFVAMIVNLFVQMPAFHLAISLLFAFVSGGFIMYQTNMIVRGGERNYILATVTLYISIVNIFLTLLQILSMFAGNRD